MTKQEEIREGIADLLPEIFWDGFNKWHRVGKDYPFRQRANKILKYLHSQGVVIKVGRNTADFIKCPCDDCTAEHKLIDEWGYFCDLTCGKRSYWRSRLIGCQDMLRAGYVAVEPLVKE